MGKEPADVTTAFEQYRENVGKIAANIDGIIDRLVENFDDIHANPVVQKQIDDTLNRMKTYLDLHIAWHTKFNKTINCFPSLFESSQNILLKIMELQNDIQTLLVDLVSAKKGNKDLYHKKIIPKLREVVKKYRQLSLLNGLKQCIEMVVIKPLTMIDKKIIHPLQELIQTFTGPIKKEEEVEPTPPIKDLVLSEIMQRISDTMSKIDQTAGSRRRRNKQHRRKKTRKNIRKKLNGLY